MIALEHARAAERYGGKAAGLARALAAGLPVPRGLALDHAALSVALEERERRLALAHAVTSSLRGPLAIRSSALDEDGRVASFAGQHLTVLNAYGAEAVSAALLAVWNSGRGEGARAYRARLGLPAEPRMAIVVQELVPAEIAGVLFTRNPATGADERVIEAARGLGEAVVQGLVTPERVRLARDGRVLEHAAAVQDLMVVPGLQGGTEQRELSPEACILLRSSDLSALSTVAAAAERHFEGPLDIEWAIQNGNTFVLQVRRITR